MLFKISAARNDDDKRVFFYDNETNILQRDDGHIFKYGDSNKEPVDTKKLVESIPFSKDVPLKKSKLVKKIKLQLGLSCNYSCSYCSQRFIERAAETSKKDIDIFMEKLENLEFDEQLGLRLEMWGGEPLVYWKTLVPLVERLKNKFKYWKSPPEFTMITNGSLLNKEKCQWLYEQGFFIAISHDGPGQHIRGPDPFDDPVKKKDILDFYRLMKPLNRISFNSILSASNYSRKTIFDWFVNLTDDPNVILGEGVFVDSYDEGGLGETLNTLESHFKFRQVGYSDFMDNNGNIGFWSVHRKIRSFSDSILGQVNAKYVGQKCGMDDAQILALDLRGNVITCQNTSAVEISNNGESHLGGTLDDIESVEIKSATHWRNRPDCAGCPVLHLCKGSCMFLDNNYWEASCNTSYSENISIFCLTFEQLTGYVPYFIDSPNLTNDRKDIWGWIFEHPDIPKKNVFPIKVVVEKTIVNELEVYRKSSVTSI